MCRKAGADILREGAYRALSAQSCRHVVVLAVYDPKGGARNGWRAPVPTWDTTAVNLGIGSETVVELSWKTLAEQTDRASESVFLQFRSCVLVR